MPSGVFQASASRSPPGAERAAAARQAARLRESSAEGAVIGGADRAVDAPIIAAPAATIAAMPTPRRQPRRRRRPRRRHRPSRRPARAPARRPAPLQADHARHADRDGPQDLAVDRPAAAGPAQHRRQPRPRLGTPTAPSAPPSLDAALALAGDAAPVVHVIGGAEIYALALPLADELQLTEIDAEFPADTFFPAWDRRRFAEVAREPRETAEGLRYAFVTYRKLPQGRLTPRRAALDALGRDRHRRRRASPAPHIEAPARQRAARGAISASAACRSRGAARRSSICLRADRRAHARDAVEVLLASRISSMRRSGSPPLNSCLERRRACLPRSSAGLRGCGGELLARARSAAESAGDIGIGDGGRRGCGSAAAADAADAPALRRLDDRHRRVLDLLAAELFRPRLAVIVLL